MLKYVVRRLLIAAAILACNPGGQPLCPSRPDVVDPCGPSDGGTGALPGTPDPGVVPSGTVGANGVYHFEPFRPQHTIHFQQHLRFILQIGVHDPNILARRQGQTCRECTLMSEVSR